MYCQICQKNEATVHLTEISNGVRSEMHICQKCAREQGIAVKSQVPINELLGNLLSFQPSDEELFDDSKEQICCPNCGLTLEQFKKNAVLGCPYDYEIFEQQLTPLIKRLHNGKTSHCGKVPSKTSGDTNKKQMELISLRRRLEAAVKKEDYEKAAEIRDKIKKLQ